MNTILQITIPALLVLAATWVVLSKLLNNAENLRVTDLYKANLQHITPVRLRAYERLMLLLDRTSPQTLVPSNYKAEMTAANLQIVLQNAVRQEFAHNVSQQIYVSSELWESIVAAREAILSVINLCAAQCTPATDGATLAETIIQLYENTENNPTEIAVQILKREVGKYF